MSIKTIAEALKNVFGAVSTAALTDMTNIANTEPMKKPAELIALTTDPAVQQTLRELEKLGIENCILNGDATIMAKGDIDLYSKDLAALPDLTRVILHGNFNVGMNRLTSPKGSPLIVYGHVNYGSNKMTTLEGGAHTVTGVYNCSGNELTSFKHAPAECLSLMADINKFENLKFSPRVTKIIDVCATPIKNLQHLNCGPDTEIRCVRTPNMVTLLGLPEKFKEVHSDFGVFQSFEQIPSERKFTAQDIKDSLTITKLENSDSTITTTQRRKVMVM